MASPPVSNHHNTICRLNQYRSKVISLGQQQDQFIR
jgi:hypothetical protein